MYLVEVNELRNLVQSALRLSALEEEGIREWSFYWDAMVDYDVMEYDEQEGYYKYTSKVDEMMNMYHKNNVEVSIINDLLDFMNLVDHKISIYEQKTTQFADGSAAALIFVKEKLEEIINGIEYK